MPTEQKSEAITQAKDWYKRSTGVVFTDYRGLKVKEMQKLRTNLKAKGGEIHVIKNTLFRLAAGEDAEKLPYEFHNGPTAIAFVFENESECAKAIFDYAKVSKTLQVKGGFFGGRVLDSKQIEALSKLPPRDMLVAQVIGAIAAPLSTLVSTIEALYADPIRVIGAVADKVAEGSPVPSAVEAAPVPETAAPEAPATEPSDSDAPTEDKPAAEAAEATE